MKYRVVCNSDIERLEAEVNKAISEGWKPTGGVSCSESFASWENSRKGYTESDTNHTFVQAMIHEG